MSKFRKKPIVIEAMQWNGRESWEEMTRFAPVDYVQFGLGLGDFYNNLAINTLEGRMWASPGDWIIKGVANEFYPCRADIFEATYEPVTE